MSNTERALMTFAESRNISGMKTEQYQQSFVKTMQKGFNYQNAHDKQLYANRFKSEAGLEAYNLRKISSARALVENAGTVANLTGANAEVTLDMFHKWNQQLNLTTGEMGSITLSTHQIAQDFSISADQMDRALAATNQIVENMASAGTLSGIAAENMLRTSAAMEKHGAGEQWKKIANAMSSSESFLDKSNAKQQLFVYEMITAGAENAEDLNKFKISLAAGFGLKDIRIQKAMKEGMEDQITQYVTGTKTVDGVRQGAGISEKMVKDLGIDSSMFFNEEGPDKGQFKPEMFQEFMDVLEEQGPKGQMMALSLQQVTKGRLGMGVGDVQRVYKGLEDSTKSAGETIKDLRDNIAAGLGSEEERNRMRNVLATREFASMDKIMKLKVKAEERYGKGTPKALEVLTENLKKAGLQGVMGETAEDTAKAAMGDPTKAFSDMTKTLKTQASRLKMTEEGDAKRAGAGGVFGGEGMEFTMGDKVMTIKGWDDLANAQVAAGDDVKAQKDLLDFTNQVQKKILNYAQKQSDPVSSIQEDLEYVRVALEELVATNYMEHFKKWHGWGLAIVGFLGPIGAIALAIGAIALLWTFGGPIISAIMGLGTTLMGGLGGLAAGIGAVIGPLLIALGIGAAIAAIGYGLYKANEIWQETGDIQEKHAASAAAGTAREEKFRKKFHERDRSVTEKSMGALKDAVKESGATTPAEMQANRAIVTATEGTLEKMTAQATSASQRNTQLVAAKDSLVRLERDIGSHFWNKSMKIQAAEDRRLIAVMEAANLKDAISRGKELQGLQKELNLTIPKSLSDAISGTKADTATIKQWDAYNNAVLQAAAKFAETGAANITGKDIREGGVYTRDVTMGHGEGRKKGERYEDMTMLTKRIERQLAREAYELGKSKDATNAQKKEGRKWADWNRRSVYTASGTAGGMDTSSLGHGGGFGAQDYQDSAEMKRAFKFGGESRKLANELVAAQKKQRRITAGISGTKDEWGVTRGVKGETMTKAEVAMLKKYSQVDVKSLVTGKEAEDKGLQATAAGKARAAAEKEVDLNQRAWEAVRMAKLLDSAAFEKRFDRDRTLALRNKMGMGGAGDDAMKHYSHLKLEEKNAITKAQAVQAFWRFRNEAAANDAAARMKALKKETNAAELLHNLQQGFTEKGGEFTQVQKNEMVDNLKNMYDKMLAAQNVIDKVRTKYMEGDELRRVQAQKKSAAADVELALQRLKDAKEYANLTVDQANEQLKLHRVVVAEKKEDERLALVEGLKNSTKARLDESAKLLQQIQLGKYKEGDQWVQMTEKKEAELIAQMRGLLEQNKKMSLQGMTQGKDFIDPKTGKATKTFVTTTRTDEEQEALRALNEKLKATLALATLETKNSIEERKKIQTEARRQESMQVQTDQIVNALTDVKMAIRGEGFTAEVARKAQLDATKDANIDPVVKALLPTAKAQLTATEKTNETVAEALAKQEGTPVQEQRFQDWDKLQKLLAPHSQGGLISPMLRDAAKRDYIEKYGSGEPPASIQAYREKMKNAQIVQPINIEGADEGARMLRDGIIRAHKGELIVPAGLGVGKISRLARMNKEMKLAAGSKANEDSGDTYEERRSREGRANCDCIDKLIAAQERREKRDDAYKDKIWIMQVGAFGKREVEAAHEFDQLEKISAVMVGLLAPPLDTIAKTVVGISPKVEALLGGIMKCVCEIADKLSKSLKEKNEQEKIKESMKIAAGMGLFNKGIGAEATGMGVGDYIIAFKGFEKATKETNDKLSESFKEKDEWKKIAGSMKNAPGMGLFDKGIGAEANEYTTERLIEAQESQIKESEKQGYVIAKALGMFDPEKSKEAAEIFDSSTIAMQKIMKSQFNMSGTELKTIFEKIEKKGPLGGIEINRDHFDNEELRKGYVSTAGHTDADVEERFLREKAGTGGGVGGISMSSIDKYLTQVQAGYFQAMINELEEIKENTKSNQSSVITKEVAQSDAMTTRGAAQKQLEHYHREMVSGQWPTEPAAMQPGILVRPPTENV